MKHDSGVSDVVGAILLISIVTLAMAIVSVGVLSQPPPQDIPQINAIASNESNIIFIDHTGGDSLTEAELRVRVNNRDIPKEDISITGPGTWPWSVGKTLQINYFGPGMPEDVQLIYRGGSSEILILNAYFVPPQITGGPTVIPTVTTPPIVFYRITASSGTGGTISPSGTVSVGRGASQAFYITPASGYTISNVSVDGQPAGAVSTYVFSNVLADHSISATFSSCSKTITASAGSGGTVSPSGVTTVSCGNSQTYTISPGSNYIISAILVDGQPVGTGSTYTFTNVQAAHTITASFAPCSKPAAGFTYSQPVSPPLTIQFTDQSTGSPSSWAWNFGDGSSSFVQNPTHTYLNPFNYQVTLTIHNPCDSDTTTQTIPVSPAPTPTAPTTVPTTTPPGPSCGTISGTKWNDANANGIRDTGETGLPGWQMNGYKKQGNDWIFAGSSITDVQGSYLISGLTYSPANQYKVNETPQAGWVPTVPASGESGQVTLNGPHCYETGVDFGNRQQSTVTITASAGTGGFVSPSGSVTALKGSSQTFSITPDDCYSIVDVKVDGVSQGPIPTYTFSNLQSDHTIQATFQIKTPSTITASAGSGGSISPSGSVQVSCGDSRTFLISPDSGYSIRTVLVDGQSVGQVSSYTFTHVVSGHSISASFIATPVQITSIYLNADKGGYVMPGGYMQFTVTGQYSEITIDKENFALNAGDKIILTLGKEGYGEIYATQSTIETFSFSDVSLIINGENMGKGEIRKISIRGYSNYDSSLQIMVPSDNAWTEFIVNGNPVIDRRYDSSVIQIYGLKASSKLNVLNLNARNNDMYYEGGGSGYTLS